MSKQDKTDSSERNCTAFIFARGGSKGLPRKNIRQLNGIPLIAHSINIAQQCSRIGRIIVSTDDDEIASIALQFGAEVPFMRPAELAGDKSSEFEAWQHAITTLESQLNEKLDVFVSLPPTSPMRSVEDVDNCIDELLKEDVDMVVTVKEAARSPYFNMLKNDEAGFAQLVNLAPNGKRYIRRQDVPVVYDMTTVAYVSTRQFILNSNSVFAGKVRSIIVPDERAIDIDTLLDFKFAEFLCAEKETQ
jgi:CMP-N-acetylneuraminic acid synthetase